MSLSVQEFLDKQISLADQLNLLNLCPLIQPNEMVEFGRFQVDLEEQDFKGPIKYAFINIYEYNYFLDIMNSMFIYAIATDRRVDYLKTYILNSIILSLFLNTEFYNNDYDFASEPISQELYNFFIYNRDMANTIKSNIDLCIKKFLISVEKESQFIEFNTKLTEIFGFMYKKVYDLFTLYPEHDYPYLDLYFGILNFPYVQESVFPYVQESVYDLGQPTYNIKCASDSNVIIICERIKYLFLYHDFSGDFSQFRTDFTQFIDLYFKYYGNLLETFKKLPITVAPNVEKQILVSTPPTRQISTASSVDTVQLGDMEDIGDMEDTEANYGKTPRARASRSHPGPKKAITKKKKLLSSVGGKLTVKANKKKLFKKTKKKKFKKSKSRKHFKSKKTKKKKTKKKKTKKKNKKLRKHKIS